MAIDTTSESRRSTSACIASSAAGSVDRPRRTAGGVPAMCMSSARRGVPPLVRRPFRHRWPGIGRRKVDKSGYATVPGRRYGRASAAQEMAGRNNHDVHLQFLTCVGKTHPRRRVGRGPGCQPVSSKGDARHPGDGWPRCSLVRTNTPVKPVSVAGGVADRHHGLPSSSRWLLVNG